MQTSRLTNWLTLPELWGGRYLGMWRSWPGTSFLQSIITSSDTILRAVTSEMCWVSPNRRWPLRKTEEQGRRRRLLTVTGNVTDVLRLGDLAALAPMFVADLEESVLCATLVADLCLCVITTAVKYNAGPWGREKKDVSQRLAVAA